MFLISAAREISLFFFFSTVLLRFSTAAFALVASDFFSSALRSFLLCFRDHLSLVSLRFDECAVWLPVRSWFTWKKVCDIRRSAEQRHLMFRHRQEIPVSSGVIKDSRPCKAGSLRDENQSSLVFMAFPLESPGEETNYRIIDYDASDTKSKIQNTVMAGLMTSSSPSEGDEQQRASSSRFVTFLRHIVTGSS